MPLIWGTKNSARKSGDFCRAISFIYEGYWKMRKKGQEKTGAGMTTYLPFSYPSFYLSLPCSYLLLTLYLPFTYPWFGTVMWYKGREADGAGKARRENYESYLHLTFTLPFPTLNLTFILPWPTLVWESQCGIKEGNVGTEQKKLKNNTCIFALQIPL